jgi:hypothetical protein
MQRIVVAVAVLLFAFTSFAAIGPERALTPPNDVAAPFAQIRPDIASDGSRVLAVWLDARSSLPDPPQGTFSLFASRLDENGQPLTPRGIEIVRNVYAGAVASNGDDFLVLYSALPDGKVWAVRTSTGRPATAPFNADSGTVIDLASNGNTYCAILSDPGQSQYWATILDEDGHVLHRVHLDDRIDAVTAVGDAYLAAGSTVDCDGIHACTRTVTTTRITDSGAYTRNVVTTNAPFWLYTTVARGADGALVAWATDDAESGRVVEYALVDANGAKTGAITRAFQKTQIYTIGGVTRLSAAFDGARYLLGFPVPSATPYQVDRYLAVRINTSGAILDAQPIALGNTMSEGFSSAQTASRTLLVWSDRNDIVTRSLPSFTSVSAIEAAQTVSRSAELQTNVRVASNGHRAIGVWREGEATTSIVAAMIDPLTSTTSLAITIAAGGDVVHSAPSVAAASDMFLVVWRETAADRTRVYARRVSAAGIALDATPLLLDDAPVGYADLSASDTTVASDGNAFFAAWRHEQELYGARILRDGTIAVSPFQVSRIGTNFHLRVSPSIVFTNGLYLVAWQVDLSNPFILISPLPPAYVTVVLARVTAEGVLLDTDQTKTLAVMPGYSDSVALAASADRAIAIFPRTDGLQTCVRGVVLTNSGEFVGAMPAIDCAADNSWRGREAADIAFDGRSFIAAWTLHSGPVRGTRLTSNGVPFDPFTLSPEGHQAWAPSLASWAEGTIAAYARLADDETIGNVGRVFMRTVDTAGAPPDQKRRATRH